MPRLRPDARRVVKVSYKAVDLIASTIVGLLVGLIFNRAWSAIEQEEGAPKPTDEQRGWREILLAAGLQGAIFALIKAAFERGMARGTRRLTGIWPGDEGQQPGNSA
jgi:TRAP-type C4-dicarboxylate transport system permease small subunit